MKKIITVLFSIFTIASIFAKPIEYGWEIDSTNFTAITDDENEPNDFSHLTDESNFEENCNILFDVAIRYPLEHDAWVKCYCDPVGDYIWYTIFYGDDNNWWINLAYDSNGSKGETFYATKNKSLAYLNFRDDASGKEVAAIELTNTNDSIVVLQDAHNPRDFTIAW